jgi:small subunit ribosomal protein S3Ae
MAEKKTQATRGQKKTAEKSVRKWKGKDWYAILAPEMFGKKPLGEAPTIEMKTVVGRTIEVSLSSLVPRTTRHFVKLRFKVDRIEDKSALTKFAGITITRDQMFRMSRKGTKKVEIQTDVTTKDKWDLQFTTITMTNGDVNKGVRTEMRNIIGVWLKDFASKVDIDTLVRDVTSSGAQKNLKRICNKIYPVRFNEITKVEVVKEPTS